MIALMIAPAPQTAGRPAPGIESAAGSIRVLLQRADPGSRVELLSSRPTHAVGCFEGRSAVQAVAGLPRLFGVCVRAHQAAAAAALGIASPAGRAELRAENLREHLLRVYLDWPLLLGRNPQASLPTGLLQACADLDADPAAARRLVEEHTLGMATQAFLDLPDTAALLRWARAHAAQRPAAAMLLHVARQPALLPLAEVAPLGVIDLPRAAQRLDAARADDFVRQPEIDGACRQTGAWARQCGAPLLADLQARGRPLLARYAARLRELAQAIEGGPDARDDPWYGLLRSAPGIACVETSRGSLLHRIAMAPDGSVARWRAVAPTEWNFHPRGAAATLLQAIPAPLPTSRRAELARLAVHAADPCVSSQCVVDEGEAGGAGAPRGGKA